MDYDQIFKNDWMLELLGNINQTCEEKNAKQLLSCCAGYHYRQLGMDEILDTYMGKLEAFIQFIEKEWGWIVKYDSENKVILANENKNECVCPVVRGQSEKVSDVICLCSENFAEKMFSKVLGYPVQAKVISSILKGNQSCIYQIQI